MLIDANKGWTDYIKRNKNGDNNFIRFSKWNKVMSLQKIGHASTPDADSLKRDILQDTLYYNIHEQ